MFKVWLRTNEYVKSNLTDQAIVRCILHTTHHSQNKLYNNDTVEISCSTELGYGQIGKNVYRVHEVEEGDRYETCDQHAVENGEYADERRNVLRSSVMIYFMVMSLVRLLKTLPHG